MKIWLVLLPWALAFAIARPSEAAELARLTRPPVDRLAIPRGPIEIRDEYMLSQPRMTLPAVSPDVLARGRWDLRATIDWGNDFTFSQTGPAEDPRSDRRYIVDGEHRTFALQATYGLGRRIDLTVRIPIQWRGAGILDPFIDWFHEITGTMDNARPEFLQNKYRIEGRDQQFRNYDWNDEHGTGLGNTEVSLRWAFKPRTHARSLRAAVIGRVGLPTGTGPFETGSFDLGLQLALAKQLHRRWDLYGGAGGTWYSEKEIRGFLYKPFRAYGFLALEWRPLRRWSLLLQTDMSSRLVDNVQDFPGFQWYAHLGVKYDLDRCARLFLGITENVLDQQCTLDVGFWAGIEARF